jgi:hypothetical protein
MKSVTALTPGPSPARGRGEFGQDLLGKRSVLLGKIRRFAILKRLPLGRIRGGKIGSQ